jgi:hypothetical protein
MEKPMARFPLVSMLFLMLCPSVFSQAPTDATIKPSKEQELVEEWFGRLNDLDDWFISMDGKEENSAVVDRFLELFSTEAYLQVGPSAKQLGTVVYHGPEGVRKWTDEFSRSYLDLNYRTHFKTRNEKTVKPVHVFQMPGEETAVAVEFTGVYTVRHDRRRVWIPGAAFFVFDKGGKIQDLRLYLLRDEAEQTTTYVGM